MLGHGGEGKAEGTAGTARTASPFTLRARDLSSGGDGTPIRMNRVATIDNALFSGKVLLRVKHGPRWEPHAAYFEGKGRLLDIQLQGRFKVPPQGVCFLGGEVPVPSLNMGRMARWLTGGIFAILRRLTRGLNHSLGNGHDPTSDPDRA